MSLTVDPPKEQKKCYTADPPNPLDEPIHRTDNIHTSGTTSSGNEGTKLILILYYSVYNGIQYGPMH